MSIDNDYQIRLEQQLERWNSEIQKFRVIAEVADKDAQTGHYQIIDALTDRIGQFADRLEQVKRDPVSLQNRMEDEFEKMKEAIEEAIASARTKIN